MLFCNRMCGDFFKVYSLDTPKAFHSFYGPEPSDQAQRFQYSEVLTCSFRGFQQPVNRLLS